MKVIDCEQGTSEWFAARLGKVTASRIDAVTARTKTGYSAHRANYAAQLVAERLTGNRIEGFTNDAMRWGSEQEPAAREMYGFAAGVEVKQVGLVMHPRIANSCASPDGLVGENGLVEIKCPSTATHIETLLGGAIEGKYVKQMHWQMLCTGRDWCDFVSFDPRMPAEMQLYVQRVERDPLAHEELESEVVKFLAEVDATVAALRKRYGMDQAA